MVTDYQVRRLRRLDLMGVPKGRAAAQAGMDDKTARKYRRLGRLPSEVSMEHPWRTKPDPFADVWPQLEQLLAVNPGLEAKTLLEHLQRQHPGRFADGQVRTLQRRVKRWRALQGPAKEVFFSQVHEPGRLCASDFTHCDQLGVTIAHVPFPHLIYHFVLTYSNWETGTLCFSESLESLSEGLQNALWELGGSPDVHRTDRLTAAVPPGAEAPVFQRHYQGLLEHYGLKGQAIQAGKANENGDAEQSHRQLKRALDQALMLRGSRDFASRDDYWAFVRQLFGQLNAGRRQRFAEEVGLLRPLPARRLEACRRLRVKVGTGSTIRVAGNVYSVASRLIGEWVEARLYAERVEVWYAQRRVEQMPRLHGQGQHRVEYRHVIDWLVRKPGAFADYCYREDLFPSSPFRRAYDVLRARQPARAAKEYLGILYLAARRTECGVEAVLVRLLEAGGPLSAAAVEEELGRSDKSLSVIEVSVAPADLAQYDALLGTEEVCDGGGQGCDGGAAGVPEGTGLAGDAGGLRGAGASGASGGSELRELSAVAGGAGVSAAAAEARGAAAAGVAAAGGQELAGAGAGAVPAEGAAAGAGAAGGVVRGAEGECARIRTAGIGEDAFTVCAGAGVGAGGTEGAVPDMRAAGAGAAGREEGPATSESAEAAVGVRGLDRGRPGLCPTKPGGDGGAVHALGGALRAGERAADEQPAVLRVGGDLQGPDDDGGGDRPAGASLGDHRIEPAELPGGAGEEGQAAAGAK